MSDEKKYSVDVRASAWERLRVLDEKASKEGLTDEDASLRQLLIEVLRENGVSDYLRSEEAKE